jgi:hypothetical protein
MKIPLPVLIVFSQYSTRPTIYARYLNFHMPSTSHYNTVLIQDLPSERGLVYYELLSRSILRNYRFTPTLPRATKALDILSSPEILVKDSRYTYSPSYCHTGSYGIWNICLGIHPSVYIYRHAKP